MAEKRPRFSVRDEGEQYQAWANSTRGGWHLMRRRCLPQDEKRVRLWVREQMAK